MCPKKRFAYYKRLFRPVLCYKNDWDTLLHLLLPLLLITCNKLSFYQTTCYRQFQCLQKLPCWKPLVIPFCSSLCSTLLLIERTMIDPLYLWVINSFFRSIIPAAGILPLCVNLAYYERKGIRITPKSIITHKNIINNSRKTWCKMSVSGSDEL